MKHIFLSRVRRGSAIVEFALVSPLLVTMFFGAWQYGYAFLQYNALEQAVRAGGRFASLAKYKAPEGAAPDAEFLTAVRNVVVYGSPAGGEEPVVNSLTPEHVFVEVAFTKHQPSSVRVWVDGYTIPGVFTTFTMKGKPSVRFPWVGNWAPPVA